jgi:hypothetical protein
MSARALAIHAKTEITFTTVIPAQAGIHSSFGFANAQWIPAFAGMTSFKVY